MKTKTNNVSGATVDDRYYQVATPGSPVERMVVRGREAIYQDFIQKVLPAPDATILDVGVSDVITDAANMLERRYPHPGQITAAGLGRADGFRAAHPNVGYVQIAAGQPLPYPDRHFAIATSNAVLEHVGSREAQYDFIRELMRVSHQLYVTVPHRYFPIEHHTNIPLLHWTNQSFSVACRLAGKKEWAQPSNLIMMSKHRLSRLFTGIRVEVGYTGIRLGPFSSNLYAHVSRT